MNRIITIIAIMLCMHCASGQSDSAYMTLANKTFHAGDPDKAKALYLKAAAMHNADAHYALAYQYILSPDERIYHLSEAAKAGHGEALSYLMDDLLFRAGSLTRTDPKLAFDIYITALQHNPKLDFFDIKGKVSTLRKCLEAGPFDGQAFMKKYHLTEDSLNGWYGIWQLAEEASRGGRFGKPDAKLSFQLVIRGGIVPAEVEGAVDFAYHNWKENKGLEFKLCDYVTSGIGMGYCAQRAAAEAEAEYQRRIDTLTPLLKNQAGAKLRETFGLASAFIESKSWNEEGHDGSGYAAWALGSIMEQKAAWLDLVLRINRDSLPEGSAGSAASDRRLNETYQKVLKQLKEKSISGMNYTIEDSNVIRTEIKWIPYRDAAARLFATIRPDIDQTRWLYWLTEIRIEQLKAILLLE